MTAWITVVGIIAGVATLIWLLRVIFRDPLRFFGGLLRNLVVGCAALLVLDYAGKSFGFHVPVNGYTAGVASILGIPGIAALAVIQKWII